MLKNAFVSFNLDLFGLLRQNKCQCYLQQLKQIKNSKILKNILAKYSYSPFNDFHC